MWFIWNTICLQSDQNDKIKNKIISLLDRFISKLGIYCSWLDIRLVSTIFSILQCIFPYMISRHITRHDMITPIIITTMAAMPTITVMVTKSDTIFTLTRYHTLCSRSALCYGISSEISLVEIEDIIFWQQLKLLLLLFRLLKFYFLLYWMIYFKSIRFTSLL